MKCLILAGAIVFTLVPSPVQAQFCWGFWGGCPSFEQPNWTGEVRHHARHHRANKAERTKKHERTYTKRTWQGMSQDTARNWVLKQVTSFCSKYPSDVGCKKKE